MTTLLVSASSAEGQVGSKKRKKTGGNPAVRGDQDSRPRPRPAPASDLAAAPVVDGVGPATQPRARVTPGRSQDRPAPLDAFFQIPVDERQPAEQGWRPAVLEDAEPQAVAATYTFPAPEGGPCSTAIRFTGVRQGIDGDPGPRDQFQRVERLDNLPGGSPVSVTTRVQNVSKGEWRVLAQFVEHPASGPRFPDRMIETSTQFGQLAQGPGVRLWAWPLLVGLGAVLAVVLQAVLAADAGLDVAQVLGLSVVGCLLGFGGGKMWYLALHRKPLREFLSSGACIQGFLVGALGVLGLGSAVLGMPVLTVLDVTTPGIFLGVALGRPGCLLTGCCVGRPTSSRWGLVSSDRRLVIRRVPVQLYEALAGLVIGTLSLVAVLRGVPVPGAVFVAAIAAYTLVRQLLFPLRVQTRTPAGRLVTIAVSSSFLLGAAATFLV